MRRETEAAARAARLEEIRQRTLDAQREVEEKTKQAGMDEIERRRTERASARCAVSFSPLVPVYLQATCPF